MLNNRKRSYMKINIMYIVIISIFLLTGCSSKPAITKLDNEDFSSKFFDNQLVGPIEIENFNIAVDDDNSYINFDVKNIEENDVFIENIKINLYDNDDLVITVYGYVGGLIKSMDSKHVTITVDDNLYNISRVVFERM